MAGLNLFRKKESLLAVDVGSASVKFLELSLHEDPPRIEKIISSAVQGEIFTSNLLTKGEIVAEKISTVLETHHIDEKRVVLALPGPSIFSKKIRVQRMGLSDLSTNIHFEASNFIPHNIDAVKIDFHILGATGRSNLDVLVVAAKDEVIDSYLDAVALSGLQTAIVDVDYFALQNIFEFSYPEFVPETTAIIHVGSRFTLVNIVRAGQSLFAGDISVGTRSVFELLEGMLSMKPKDAESLLRGELVDDGLLGHAKSLLDEQAESFAAEINRQMTFFWSASGAEEGIARICLSGGGSTFPGLREVLAEKSGLEVMLLDPFKNFSCGEGVDEKDLEKMRPIMSIAAGLALRQPGDKIIPEDF